VRKKSAGISVVSCFIIEPYLDFQKDQMNGITKTDIIRVRDIKLGKVRLT